MSTEEMIRKELFEWDIEIANQYLTTYPEQLQRFFKSMDMAYHAWKKFDETVNENRARAHISALIFGTLSLHLTSTKLLVWGLLVPSGNIMRQVLETVCMAFLASKPALGYIELYESNRYSTGKAVRDVLRNSKKLNLARDALDILKEARDFYDKFSHPTLLTMTTFIALGGDNTYLGASFDPGKQDAYQKEISTRVQVAGLLTNMIQRIRYNLDG
jgi:hypothetical protein